MNFSNHENSENLTFFAQFLAILDHYKIKTRTNFENPNGKSLDPHLIM